MCPSYTKPETVRRDGSNEVAWAFNESLLALLFTHHRFLLNRSIAAGRARARPIRKFALSRYFARVVSLLLERFSGANPPRILCAYCCSVPELGIGHRAPADQAQPCAYAPPAATPTAPWPPQAPAGDDHGGWAGLQHPIDATSLGACPPVPEVPEARDQPFGAASYVCRVWKTAIWGVHYINFPRRRYGWTGHIANGRLP